MAKKEKPSDHPDEWRLELQPALGQLAAQIRNRERSERPVLLPVGDEQLEVNPAEWELILKGNAAVARLPRHFQLVCDGVGMRTKLLLDLAELAHAEEEAHLQAAAILRRDLALGHRLVHAMHLEIAALTGKKLVEEAKRLAEHRGQVSDALQHAVRTAGDDAKAPGGAPVAAPEPRRGRPPRFKAAHALSERQRKIAGGVAAALLSVILVVLLLRLYSGREQDLPSLSAADLAQVPGVENVICRAPQLIVVVSPKAWNKLSPALKRQAVDTAVQKAETIGYRRVEFRTSTRHGLAKWTKGEPVQLPD